MRELDRDLEELLRRIESLRTSLPLASGIDSGSDLRRVIQIVVDRFGDAVAELYGRGIAVVRNDVCRSVDRVVQAIESEILSVDGAVEKYLLLRMEEKLLETCNVAREDLAKRVASMRGKALEELLALIAKRVRKRFSE